ncbi:MAG: apolipoprotein N-acyltransferase [Bacteroidota bacterium]|nr:apolipoprotein N-acyltransferase [Bacteroidota bacterium]MDP4194143.1 apolipoprotein N-acyltransferase [Bacteroidota bacterium]
MKFINLFKRAQLTPEQKKERNKGLLLGILSGIMMGLAFPPVPFPFTLLLFFGLVPYFSVLIKKEKLVDINRFTYLCFFVFNVITIYWVGSWTKEADTFLMIGGFLLLFINTAFFLIPSTLYYFARKVFNTQIALLLFPFFWVSYEYFYMLTDASFPWLTLGNGLTYFSHFVQIADILGAMGLSLLVIFINLAVFLSIKYFRQSKKKSYSFGAIALILFFLPIVYGTYVFSSFKNSEKTIRVGLIQPNLDPWEKWKGGDLWGLTKDYIDLSSKTTNNGAEMIFWPETALPVYLRDGSYRNIIDSIYTFIQKKNVFLVTGMPDFKFFDNKSSAPPDAKFSKLSQMYYATYNSVLLFSPHSYHIERYAKMKLVPFGERVPFVDALPFLGDFIKWNVGISGWNVGRDTIVFSAVENVKDQRKNSYFSDTVKINSLVCFESVYPAFVAAFAQKGAQLISVVTNDSWYGNSSGPYQHKEIGVLRAIENRRAVIRAANGGISAIIDPLGRTLAESKMYTKTYLVGDVPLEKELTFYSRHPLLIPGFCSFISILTVLIFLFKKVALLAKKF